MIDKFKILNKVKIDTEKYKEIETNKEDLKVIMEERLKSSERIKKNNEKNSKLIRNIACIAVLVIGVGVINPTLADNLKKRLPEFETMLDKIKLSIDDGETVEYHPELYPEREEEKKEHRNNKLISTPIDVSSDVNGLKITIDKAMYDKKKLYLDMTLKTNEPFEKSDYRKVVGDSPYGDGVKEMYIDDLKIEINGVAADNYGYGPGVVTFIDENTINLSYLIELDISNDIDDANFKISFGTRKYEDSMFVNNNKIDGRWSFDFDIKAIDDEIKSLDINQEDNGYILKKVNVTETYIKVIMELPFQPSLENPHNNFVIVRDDKGRELKISEGVEGKNKLYTQINELINVGEIPKYIDVLICENHGQEDNPISNFRVNLE